MLIERRTSLSVDKAWVWLWGWLVKFELRVGIIGLETG